MPDLRHIIRVLFPPVVTKIFEAQRLLDSVSNHPWIEALSPVTLINISKSRFPILPMSFKSLPGFVIDVGANSGEWIGALLHLLSVREVWIFEPNPEAMKI